MSTRVMFKDEGCENGEPVGPVTVVTDGRDTVRRAGESTPKAWVTRSEAQAVAAEHGVVLEES